MPKNTSDSKTFADRVKGAAGMLLALISFTEPNDTNRKVPLFAAIIVLAVAVALIAGVVFAVAVFASTALSQ